MKRAVFLLLCMAPFSPVHAGDIGTRLDERQLASERAGFQLSNGLDVSMAVTSEARIDGQVVLRSVYTVQDGASSLQVLGADGTGGLGPGAGNGTIQVGTQGGNSQVRFSTAGTDIVTMTGDTFGSLVANRADGRAIDVDTVVNLDIGNATIANLGSALPRIEDLALTSAALLAP